MAAKGPEGGWKDEMAAEGGGGPDRDPAFICYLAYFHLEGKQFPTRHTHTYTRTYIYSQLYAVRRK